VGAPAAAAATTQPANGTPKTAAAEGGSLRFHAGNQLAAGAAGGKEGWAECRPLKDHSYDADK